MILAISIVDLMLHCAIIISAQKKLSFAELKDPFTFTETEFYKNFRETGIPLVYSVLQVKCLKKQKFNFKKTINFFYLVMVIAIKSADLEKKRYMSKRFKETLQELLPTSSKKQHIKLSETIQAWKGVEEEQLDDILVLGIKI